MQLTIMCHWGQLQATTTTMDNKSYIYVHTHIHHGQVCRETSVVEQKMKENEEALHVDVELVRVKVIHEAGARDNALIRSHHQYD